MKPLIGVTTSRRGKWRNFLMPRIALWRAGAKAVRLLPGEPAELDGFSALVIGGGDDIGAELYGGKVLPDVRIDPARDKLEFALLRQALAVEMPVLGICRGAQVINVALGGTLHTDIYEVYEKSPRMRTVLPRKNVTLIEDSRLYKILRCNPCRVNALHHQSIDVLGRGLRIVGTDEAGIVQAIEGSKEEFLIGVQWHPEFLVQSGSQQRIFQALVAAAQSWATTNAVRDNGRVAAEARR
jgi:putative glutamine amidotransferase